MDAIVDWSGTMRCAFGETDRLGILWFDDEDGWEKTVGVEDLKKRKRSDVRSRPEDRVWLGGIGGA
jgi:hypothetical protein